MGTLFCVSPLRVSWRRVSHFGVAGMHWRQSQSYRGWSSSVLVRTGRVWVCVCVRVRGGRCLGPGAAGPGVGGCSRATAVLALLLPVFGSLFPGRGARRRSTGRSRCCCCCSCSLLLHLQHLPTEPSQPLATLNTHTYRKGRERIQRQASRRETPIVVKLQFKMPKWLSWHSVTERLNKYTSNCLQFGR